MHRILCFAVIWIMPLSIIRCQPPAKSVSPADEAAADRAIDPLSQAREVAESQANTLPPPAVQRKSRKKILDTLSPLLKTSDTPRGVVITVLPSKFQAGSLRPDTAEKIAQVAAMVVAHPGLKVVMEGYTESGNSEVAQSHAQAVRDTLIDTGVHPDNARAIAYAKSPLVAYSTHSDNGRVEIVISGPAIGTVALSAGRKDTLASGQR
jgi:outer membrane protein OmpA-like peptidoglycan-associated protein